MFPARNSRPLDYGWRISIMFVVLQAAQAAFVSEAQRVYPLGGLATRSSRHTLLSLPIAPNGASLSSRGIRFPGGARRSSCHPLHRDHIAMPNLFVNLHQLPTWLTK
jgi:hypothetical protein